MPARNPVYAPRDPIPSYELSSHEADSRWSAQVASRISLSSAEARRLVLGPAAAAKLMEEVRQYLSQQDAKVVFLDCDGVLHPTLQHGGSQALFMCRAAKLEKILRETGARVVLISSWRLHAESRERVEKLLRDRGLPPLLHVTPSNTAGGRGGEIMDWLMEACAGLPQPPRWVVLDDEPLTDLAKAGAGRHHVRPSPATGLTDDDARAAIGILNGPAADGLGFKYQRSAVLRAVARFFE